MPHPSQLEQMLDPTAEWRAERRDRRLALYDARVPPAHRRPGDLHPEVAAWAKGLAGGEPRNLALVGGVGVGKTWHAWRAPRAALEEGWDGRVDFAGPGDLRARIAPRADQSHHQAIAGMQAAGLLVLDDVGANRASDWWLESLHAVVDHRWSHELPTLVTSNVADLRGELGERIASRLAQRLVLVTLTGPDRRRAS